MQFGRDDTGASGIEPGDEMSLPAALSVTELSAGELVDVITHCASITYAVPNTAARLGPPPP